MSCSIYVLECEGGRYYIGKSEGKFLKRVDEHFLGNGCEWTKRYPPIRLIESFHKARNVDEDIKTKEYMRQYGVDLVRGGSYSQLELPQYKQRALQDEFRTIDNGCFRCGRLDHFISACNAREHVDGNQLASVRTSRKRPRRRSTRRIPFEDDGSDSDSEDDDSQSEDDAPPRPGVCYRCGRDSHYANQCYARTDVEGYRLDD
jgi:predicted GIY-YIG superfamily endonuclease